MRSFGHVAMVAVSGALIAASVGGCVGGSSSPTAPSTFTVTHSPGVGATVANRTSYQIRVDEAGSKGHIFTTIAFVSEDGSYSRPFVCGETNSSGGSGGHGAGLTHDVTNTIDPLNFAVGRRVNLVVLYSSRSSCSVLSGAPPVDPSQADLGRKDWTLNWLVGG